MKLYTLYRTIKTLSHKNKEPIFFWYLEEEILIWRLVFQESGEVKLIYMKHVSILDSW